MARAGARIAVLAQAALAGLSPAAAGDPAPISFADAAAQVCAALVMRPDKAAAVLGGLGFKEKDSKGLGAKWTFRTFQREDTGAGPITVIATSKTFADATSRSCQMSAMGQPQALDIAALRARLEADPDIGRLDGDVALNIASLMKKTDEGMAYFKRPGNDPVVTTHITRTARFSFISMSRMDLDAKTGK